VQWSLPRPGWHKLNFDGSVHHDGSGRASIGGVIRDCYGRTMLAFAERTPHAGVGEVEARALIRGLHLALHNGCDRLVVEGDDLTLVRLLRGESPHTRISWATYDHIIQLLCRFRDVEVQHVYREGNQVADALCHEAYRCPNVWTAGQPVPAAVWTKLEDDRRGVVQPRFRPA
jgi:ribonuclease HI